MGIIPYYLLFLTLENKESAFYTKWTQKKILPFQSQLEFIESNAWCYNVTDSLAHLSYHYETVKSWQLFYNDPTQFWRINLKVVTIQS